MPLPPGTTSFPPSNSMGAAERRSFYVDTFVKGSTGARNRRGPYLCNVVPSNGTTQVTNNVGEMVTVEKRVYLPIVSGARARAVVVDIQTNEAYEVLYVQRWSTSIEAWVKKANVS